MKRIFAAFLIILSLSVQYSRADEGMWLLPLLEELNMSEMDELGIQLTAEQIYSVNNSSIKDAIVSFGGGCTGEIVSDNGLLFTNHHCGYDYIQDHSSVDEDYLKDGFWAMSRDEELPNPDLTVQFLERIEDVTELIFQDLSDTMSEKNRSDQIKKTITEIEEDASEEGRYIAKVKPYFDGNYYYLCVYSEYKDVRFVGAPPSSIGKFGYDTDNWQWPRHTGDFSIFRVYTAPDGTPAEYAKENIPLKPKHYLPVSLDGVKTGDFTFVMGYPGRTDRYLSSFGILETMNIINTNRIKIREARLEILRKDMDKDPKVNIQYASKYSRSSNYWKYSIGQNKGIRALNVIDKKRQEEADFQKWVEADSVRISNYGNVLSEIEKQYDQRKESQNNFYVLNEAFFSATELISFMADFQYLTMFLNNPDKKQELESEVEMLTEATHKFFKNYNQPTDEKMSKAMFTLYGELIPESRQPAIYQDIRKKYKGDIDKFVNELFKKTLFADKQKVLSFLENPNSKMLKKDLGFQVTSSIFTKYLEEYNTRSSINTQLAKNERAYMKGRLEMNPELKFYPDANFSMRLTYGTVQDYSPADAVHYSEITYLKGVLEKEDTTNFEFYVPDVLKNLYLEKDYGPYGINDKMPVCFITTNDITGGNSGSPVLNAEGELIGLAFDGNIEAMSGDIAFEKAIQRCICVDVRYVLFIIDKYAGAGHLIEELKIAN